MIGLGGFDELGLRDIQSVLLEGSQGGGAVLDGRADAGIEGAVALGLQVLDDLVLVHLGGDQEACCEGIHACDVGTEQILGGEGGTTRLGVEVQTTVRADLAFGEDFPHNGGGLVQVGRELIHIPADELVALVGVQGAEHAGLAGGADLVLVGVAGQVGVVAFQVQLEDVFKLNLEGNHANLAGHTYQHEIRTAREAGVLGSLDANQGDKLIGWDMDEFPTDLYETSTVMWEVLAEGQIGPHGGLNFDAKPRRTSFTAEDLFRSHIAGMDSFAAGLLVAAKMHEDKVIENLQAERYSSFDSGIGATVENGTASLASLEEYALDIPQSKLIEATKSDHLESVKATINNYMIDALAEA